MGTLEVRPRRPRTLLAAGTGVLVVALGLGWWQATDPSTLPTSDEVVNATTPVGAPVYLGVVAADASFGRTLHLSGVKVHATSNTGRLSIAPLLCRGGQVGVTTEPELFCVDLVNPEGQAFGGGDSIVLQVVSDQPGVAVIDPVRLGFRENLTWGTLPAGSGAVVTVIAR